MTSTPANYPFPETLLHPGPVQWTNGEFLIGGDYRCKVLCYDNTQSNWSDELTRLHEEEGGAHHPIDTASRRLAVRSVQTYAQSPAPVVLDVGCSSGFLLEELHRA